MYQVTTSSADRSRRRLLHAVACVGVGLAGLATSSTSQPVPSARPPAPLRVLLDRSLNESQARISKIDGSGVWSTTPSESTTAAPRARPLSDLVAILSVDPVRPPREDDSDQRPRLTVTLTDGQRLVGRLTRDTDGQDAATTSKDAPLRLDTALGAVRLALDTVATVSVGQPGVPSTETPKKDTVTLSNDDRLEGFVESIGASVAVQPDGAAATTILIERIRAISLANPRTPPRGTLAWLGDGSVIRITDLSQAPDALPAARVSVLGTDSGSPLPALVSIVFDASRLTPFARLTPVQVHASPDRRWTRAPRALPGPAPLDAPDLELPGPMTADWELPATARRLAGTAELSRHADNWGDCSLSVEVVTGGAAKRLWSQHLSGSGAAAPFNIDLGTPGPQRRVRLVLESGERGPIQDHVILRRPLLLLDRAER